MSVEDREADELPESVRDAIARQRPVEAPSMERVAAVIGAVERDRATRRATRWLAPLAAAAVVLLLARIVIGPLDQAVPARESGQRIAFEVRAPQATQVALVGDFNGWDARATPMRRSSDPDRWEAALALPSGRYAYAYVVDGRTWLADPRASLAPPDDFARPSSVLVVSTRFAGGTSQ